ncbi:hypothetical protein [Shouchella lehensis]|nr:hypothetical protein [Shouchella lehensis]
MNTLVLEKGVKEMNTFYNGYFQYPYQTNTTQYDTDQLNRNSYEVSNGFVPHQTNEYQQMHHVQQTNNGHSHMHSNQQSYAQANTQHFQGALKDQCQQMKDHHVELKMSDGQSVDGILTEIREDGVMLLVGEDTHHEEGRQYGGWRFRRYRPRFFPFGRFGGIGFFPYFYPLYFF